MTGRANWGSPDPPISIKRQGALFLAVCSEERNVNPLPSDAVLPERLMRLPARLALLLAFLSICPGAFCEEPGAGVPAPGDVAQAAVRRSHNHHSLSAAQRLDEHVRALTKALDLDKKQQAGVRDILIQERIAILALRKGGTHGAQDVVSASHAIVVRTRSDIRALLSPEQRTKFFVDVPQDQLGPAQADLNYWLDATRAKPAPSTASTMAPAAPPGPAPAH